VLIWRTENIVVVRPPMERSLGPARESMDLTNMSMEGVLVLQLALRRESPTLVGDIDGSLFLVHRKSI